MGKEERLLKLRAIALRCTECALYATRTRLVFGEGSPDALVMFIGEGPGREEDETGRPFVGRSGKLLRDMCEAIGITEDYRYIANIVKDRPPKNRDPEKEEIASCIKFLRKQIEIIQPKLLVLLGKTAIKGICPEYKKESVENLRAMTKNPGAITFEDIPVIVTYHPSALLRASWRKVGAKDDFKFLQDIFNSLKF